MLKKIVMTSVLSSILGFTCYEAEGTLDLSQQVRDSGVPGAPKAARRMMRNLNRSDSVENFQQFIWQHPEATSAAANYIATNTAEDGSAVGGNNYARFIQGWNASNAAGKVTIPANAVTQNPNGSYSVDFNALNSFVEKSMNAALMAAKRAPKPNEPGFVTALRNEFIQIEKDSEGANLQGNDAMAIATLEQEILNPQTQDPRAQRIRQNIMAGMYTQQQLQDAVAQEAARVAAEARQGFQQQLQDEVDQAHRDAEMYARDGFYMEIENYMRLPSDQQNDLELNQIRDMARQGLVNPQDVEDYMALQAGAQNDDALNAIRDAARQGLVDPQAAEDYMVLPADQQTDPMLNGIRDAARQGLVNPQDVEDYMALDAAQQYNDGFNAIRDVARQGYVTEDQRDADVAQARQGLVDPQEVEDYMALPAYQQTDPVLNSIRDAARRGQN